MTQPEYEQKKRECWEEFKQQNLDGEVQWQPVSRYDVFCATFDRAYTLGKLQASCRQVKEIITQEEIENEAIDYAFAENKKRPDARPDTAPEYMSEDLIDAFKAGANFALGKEEKHADTVIQGWVARDDGERWHERELHLFTRNKPERRKLMGDWIGRPSMTLDSNLFPDLTWSDDPIEVDIIIKRKNAWI